MPTAIAWSEDPVLTASQTCARSAVLESALRAFIISLQSDRFNEEAALGTYLGWDITTSGYFKGQYCGLWGSYIPFHAKKRERLAAHDPRLSLEERYGSQRGYMCVVRRAASNLVRERFLLQEDADALIAKAAASNVLPEDKDSSEEARRIADARCNGAPPG
jgi:hypothetical protein